jgi:hypothetical protein
MSNTYMLDDGLTLGELHQMLSAIETADGKKASSFQVLFDFAGLRVGYMHSYRGFYDHLAIEPVNSRSPDALTTVKVVVEKLEEALNGKPFEGYRGGGAYRMTKDTPVWVACYGHSSGSRIVGLEVLDYVVVLHVE